MQHVLQHTQQEQLRVAEEPFAILAFSGAPEKLSEEQLRTVDREVLNLVGSATVWGLLASELSRE